MAEPAAILFLDLSKAFDKVVRETLFGMRSGEINIETRLLGLGLPHTAAKHVGAYIDKSGGILREIGVPDVTAQLVADLHDGVWFHLTPTGRTIVTRKRTHARAASLVPSCFSCSTDVCCASFARFQRRKCVCDTIRMTFCLEPCMRRNEVSRAHKTTTLRAVTKLKGKEDDRTGACQRTIARQALRRI